MSRVGSVTLLLLFGVASSMAQGQDASQPAAPPPSYLLRLERARDLQPVCVLLGGNGQYHLERHTSQKARVFEGTLDSDEMRSIVGMVSGDQLFKLEQKQITNPMMRSDDDELMLAINRPAQWQLLSFPDSVSREPYRASLDPLLRWLDALHKRKGRELSEEAGRTNCLLPSSIELARRTGRAPETSGGVAAARPQNEANRTPAAKNTYTLHMFETAVVLEKIEMTCLIVSQSGTYHLVRQSRPTRQRDVHRRDVQSVVLDGSISPADLTSLRGLLDSPEIRNEPQLENRPVAKASGDLKFFLGAGPLDGLAVALGASPSVTRLSIPRGENVQQVVGWKSLHVLGPTRTPPPDEHGTALLKPLREWLKATLNEKSAVPTRTPPNARCSPSE